MSDHYFASHPGSPKKIGWLSFDFGGRSYRFKTASGVFSRHGVDRGTQILLQNLEVRDGDRILDLGCGYGVLGVVAYYQADKTEVLLADINHRAVELARENAELNGLTRFQVLAGDGFQVIDNGREFDLIVTNPPLRAGKQKVLSLLKDAYLHLSSGGRLYFVVRTQQGAKSYFRRLTPYFPIETLAKESGYRVFRVDAHAAQVSPSEG